MALALGDDRKVAISRELSKMFEETFYGTLQEAQIHFNKKAPKGEFVIVIQGNTDETN